MKYDITALGDILIDFSPMGVDDAGDPVFVRKAGGAPLNLLATVAKFGGIAAFIGIVGEDMFGRYLVQVLRDNGIDDRALVMDPYHNTTLAFVQLDASGDRDFDFCRKTGADTYLAETDVDEDLILQSRIFHFGSLSFTAETARRASLHALKIARDAGCIITYDPNYRAPLWDCEESAIRWMREGISFADITKVSKEEARMIAGATDVDDCIQYIQDLGVGVVLVTDGANGIRSVRTVTRGSDETINLQDDPDRYYYEVQEVVRLLQEEDYDAVYARLETTIATIETIEAARKGAGIFFPGD